MTRRYITERVGQTDPQTGLGVMARPPFDFESQLRRHLALAIRQWPATPAAEHERRIRHLLRAGQAWLWPDPRPIQQMELFA